MLRVGVNGYGTIGKRVADAVAAQPDMTVVGVAKRSVDATARSAVAAGYSLYRPAEVLEETVADGGVADRGVADADAEAAPEAGAEAEVEAAPEAGAEAAQEAGADASSASTGRVPVVGTVEDLVAESDVVVDATPGGVGAEYAPLYAAHDTPALFQGAESADVADVSFNARANFDDAVGADAARVVSCNTTGLARLLAPLDESVGVERVRATLVRRGGDPAQPDRGPIDDVLPDPVSLPSHHGAGLRTVLPDLDVDTMALKVPATRMHLHAVNVTLSRDVDEERIRWILEREPRVFLVPGEFAVDSCGGLKELAKDVGRPRGDVWENCVWADSIAVRDGELFCFQAIHQEADVVPENVDAIRAVTGVASAGASRSMTNRALGLDDPPVVGSADVGGARSASD